MKQCISRLNSLSLIGFYIPYFLPYSQTSGCPWKSCCSGSPAVVDPLQLAAATLVPLLSRNIRYTLVHLYSNLFLLVSHFPYALIKISMKNVTNANAK